ncbi:MAG: PAS domain S-box protein [Candidatus Hodarchaeales archaeon]
MSSSASRVLLVDDDEHLLTVAKKFLTQHVSSFDVVTTKSPHDALRLLGEQPFDAIVADYQMPKMNGLELLKTIREGIFSIPFVMFTGRGREEIAIQALNLGADYYLKKEGKAKSLYTQLAHILDSLIAHKRTEEALKRSEYEKTLVLSNASDAIVYYNCNLEIIWANSVALTPIDESLEEIIGQPCHVVWRQRDTPCEDCPVVKVIGTGKPHEQEIITIDDKIWKDRVFPVRDDSGSLLGAVEISLDITELKQANAELRKHRSELEQLVTERTAELSRANEELSKEITERIKVESKLQKSEERYRFLFENAPIGIGISNAEGCVISANQQMQRITGYTIDELRTIGLRETYVNPQERDRVLQILREIGQIRDWEIKLKRKDGSIYLAQLNIDKTELDEQQVFFTTARDITDIRHAEEVLRQSEQRFRQLVETMHDAFGIQDENGLITYVNDRTCEMIGYSQDMMLGRPTIGFLDEANRKKFEEELIRRKEGERGSYELMWTRKDGSYIPTIMSSTPILDANGQYKGSFAVITDITSQKQTEDALRESEERYRTLSDAALEGIAVHEKGMILEANKAFARMFGYELSELIAKDGFELFAPESRGLARARILNESETPYEGLLIRRDGTSFPARITGTNVKFKGRLAQIITIQDITYQAVVEDQTELVCRYLPGGILTFVNEAYCRYFGKTREELINHHFLPLIPEEDQETVEKQISLLTLENPVATYEHRVITPTGEFAWQQWTDRAIFDDQGHIVEYQAVGRDITERKQIEAALQESEERYRILTELHFDGIAIHDNEAIRDINPAGAKIVGLSRDEVIGRGLFDFLPLKSVETVQKSLTQMQEAPFEIVVRKKDGQQMHLEIMPGNCKYQGQPARIAAFRDISERKQAEQQLKDSEERLRILFEYAPDGYYLHDLEGKLLDGNKAAEDITGYKREELIGKNILDLQLMPEEQIPKAAEGLMLNMDGKPSGPEQYTIFRKDRTQREVEIRTYPVIIKGQTLVLGIARDITERIQAETALLESEVKYKYLVDELQEELLIYQENRVVFANNIVTENTGYSLEELYALSPEETQATIHPDDRAVLAKRIQDRLKGIHAPSPLEYRRVNKDGAVRWIETEATLITYEGKPAIQATGRDITDRKRSEKALQQSEEKYRLLVEQSLQGVGIIQIDRVLYVNPAIVNMSGYSREELQKFSAEQLAVCMHPDDQEVLVALLQKITAGERESFRHEFRLLRKDGSIAWIDMLASFIEYQGQPAIQLVFYDLTERKQAEKALRESEETQRALINAFDDTVILTDPKGTILAINEAAAKRLEKHPDKLIGHCAYDFIPSHLAESRKKQVNEVFHHKKPVRFEDTRSGIVFDNIISPLFNAQEEVEKAVLVARDITERKKAEKGLLEREQRYRALFERTNDAVFILDLDLTHLDVNQHAADLLGYTNEELIGLSAMDMVAPQERPKAIEVAAALEARKAVPIYERTFRKKDGSEIVVELNVAYVEDADGNPHHIQSIARDITERKQTEEILQKSEERFRALFEESLIFRNTSKFILKPSSSARKWRKLLIPIKRP